MRRPVRRITRAIGRRLRRPYRRGQAEAPTLTARSRRIGISLELLLSRSLVKWKVYDGHGRRRWCRMEGLRPIHGTRTMAAAGPGGDAMRGRIPLGVFIG